MVTTQPAHNQSTPATSDSTDDSTDDAAEVEQTDSAAAYRKPSKSALKRQSHALQALGADLSELPAGRLAQMPLTDTLREAIAQLHAIRPKAREARRRQLQLIGKLMRNEDTDALMALLEQERNKHRAQSVAQQQVADMRTEIIASDQALEAFISQYNLDNEFRSLARKARRESAASKDPHSQRALYRSIQKILLEQAL